MVYFIEMADPLEILLEDGLSEEDASAITEGVKAIEISRMRDEGSAE